MDLQDFMELGPRLAEIDDVARKCKIIEVMLKKYQDYISALERCSKPVIGAVHNACIGGALDLLTATDIRMCSSDAWFQVKEVEIGMAADVGTLQRLPRVIGNQSLVNELCLTARKMPATEAKDCGFVSQIFDNKERFA
jgi:Delta3,5-Delta2,4-dienoyl-CoA isomerase